MKRKFTFLITAAMMLLTMMASTGIALGQATVTFVAGTDTGETSVTKDGITVSMSTMSRTDNYRCYKNSNMTVESTVGNITEVVVTCTANGAAQYGPGCFVIPDTYPGTYTYESDGSHGTWTGDSQTVTLRASSNQVRMTQIVVTYTSGGAQAPSFSPVTGTNFETSLDVTITPAEGTTMYYTTNGDDPDNTGTGYTTAQVVNLTETTTIKAIAYDGETPSSIVEATYTKYTFTDIADITKIDTAYTVKGTVVAVSERGFVMGDGTGYAYYYKNSAPTVAVNDKVIVSGTTTSYGHVIQFTSAATITTTTTSNYDGTPAVTAVEEDDLVAYEEGLHLSDYVQIDGTMSKSSNQYFIELSNITDVQISYPTDAQKTTMTALNEKPVRVKGYFAGINSNGFFSIVLESIEDLTPTITVEPTTIPAFSYLVDNGPSASADLAIVGSHITSDFAAEITAGAEYFEISNDEETWTDSIALPAEGDLIVVRMKGDLEAGEYEGTLTISATGAESIEIELSGIVYATAVYDVMIDEDIENGTVVADMSQAEEGDTVTLTATPAECYQFGEWDVIPDVTWITENSFTMPAEDVLVSALFTQITYTVQYSVNGAVVADLEESVDCGDTATLWTEEYLELAGVELPTGIELAGWSTSLGGATLESFAPTADTTLYAVLLQSGAVNGYELVTSASQVTEGMYLFAALRATSLPDTVKYSIASGTFSSGNNTDMQVTATKYLPTDNVFESIPEGGVEFELVGNSTDGFLIKYNSKALKYTSYANRRLAWGTDTTYLWKFYDKADGLSTGAVYMVCDKSGSNYTVSENSTDIGAIRGYASSSVYRGFYLFKKSASFNVVTEVSGTATITENIPASELVIVTEGAVLTFNGENQGTAANLVIEDGGQLIHTNAVNATVQKNVTAASSWGSKSVDGWYTIASPAAGASVSAATTGDYDLFAYDEETSYWLNQKVAANNITTFEQATGYLYANAAAKTVAYAGEMVGTASEVTKALSYVGTNDDLKGYNLVGNPFSRNLTNEDVITIGGTPMTSYVVVEGGEELVVKNISTDPIKPGQGFMVQATDENQDIVFNPSAKDRKAEKIGFISIAAGNSQFTDKAYVQIGGGNTLRKMTISDNSSIVYVMNDGKDYAATTIDAVEGSMPVCFKASHLGNYTITVEAKDMETGYLHLIDNVTHDDIDLLLEPSYSFKAAANDNPSRFTLVFKANNVDDIYGTSNIFAYQNGNNIIVNGEGELQIFDIMGRMVSTMRINGVETVEKPSQGVYVFKLNEKVQKIVVK